jgi:hypothetical protein
VSERGRNECRWKEKKAKGRKRDREIEKYVELYRATTQAHALI